MSLEGRRISVVFAVVAAIALLVAAWWLLYGGSSRVGGTPRVAANAGAGRLADTDGASGSKRIHAEGVPISTGAYSVKETSDKALRSYLTIRFIDADDRPVAGAEVVLLESTSACSIKWGSVGLFEGVPAFDLPEAIPLPDRVLASGVTDAEGSWSVPVPRGAWVRVRGTTRNLSGSSTLGRTPLDYPKIVRMLPTHILVVRVVDPEGRPLPGIRVSTTHGLVVDGDRWTGNDGVARMTVTWREEGLVSAFAMIGVRAFASGLASRAEAAAGLKVVVERGVTVIARIMGGEADSERVLVWPAAAGAVQIGGIEHVLWGKDSGSFRHFSGGEVAVVGFVPGTRVKFALFENGFRRAIAEVLIPDAPDCEVVLDAGGGFTEVSARLLDEEGRVRRCERVWARVGLAGTDRLTGADIVIITDDAGGMQTRLPAGALQLAAFREGLEDAPILDLTAFSTDLGDVVLPGPALLARGTLRDAAEAPVPGMEVEAWPVGVEREDIRPWYTETGADGTFEFRGWLRGGLIDLVVADGDLCAVVEGVPGGTTGIEMVAKPPGTLIGNVISPREDVLGGVVVQVVPSPAMDIPRAERTGRALLRSVEPSGAFEAGGLCPGIYDLLVHVLGACAHRIEGLRIPEEGGVVADPRLQAISIAGDVREVMVRVVGSEGPLEAMVTLWDDDEPYESTMARFGRWPLGPSRLPMKQTDASGEARFLIPRSARLRVRVQRGDAWRSFRDPVFPLEVVWVAGASVDVGVDLGADLPALPGVGGLELAMVDLDAAGIDSVAIGEPGTLPVYEPPTASLPVRECRGAVSVRFEDVPQEVRFGVLIAPVGAIDLGDSHQVVSRGTWHWVGEFRIPEDVGNHSVRFAVPAELISRMVIQ